jgi:ribosomal protein S20
MGSSWNRFFTINKQQEKKMKQLFYSAALLLSMVACGGKQAPTVSKEMSSHMPGWAMTPPAGCAVGSYKFKGNISLAQQTANSRGRDELSRQLDVKVKSMIKDYIEEGESNDKDFTEELTQSVSKQVASMSLSGSVSKKNDMLNGHFFSLVCLDIQTFADSFDQMSQLNEKARSALRKRAHRAFRDLDIEIDELELDQVQ